MAVTVFETERLAVRIAEPEDADLFLALWTDPRVMTNVGFPEGLDVTRDGIAARIAKGGDSEFERHLLVVRKADGAAIGEACLHLPEEDGVAGTDVKLLPEHWGHHYGAEVKQGLLDHLFTHTDCTAVRGAPNVGNVASIRMQEAVGGVRVREDTYEFPDDMPVATRPVHYYLYHVTRETWEARRRGAD